LLIGGALELYRCTGYLSRLVFVRNGPCAEEGRNQPVDSCPGHQERGP